MNKVMYISQSLQLVADSIRERVQDHHGKKLDSEQTDVVLEKWLRDDLSASRRQRELMGLALSFEISKPTRNAFFLQQAHTS